MHPRNIDRRSTDARRRISEAAAALADSLGVPPLGSIAERERRDPAVAQMRELEEIADLIDGIASTLLTGANHGNTEG
jgi:hypothetical protein